MANENSFLTNTSWYFAKIMKQKFITKKNVLQLKNQLKQLKQQDEEYNKLLNKVTRIANNAKGKNDPDILQHVYEDFQDLLIT